MAPNKMKFPAVERVVEKKSFFSIPLSPSNSENLVGYYLLQ